MNAVKNPAYTQTLGLIQLTRIGDVLQTFQAASAFKAQFPNIRLVLITREKFAVGLEAVLKDVFNQIYFLDTKKLFNSKNNAPTLHSANQNLLNFIQEINVENFDVLINVSFSKSSSYLANLIKSKHKLGMVRDNRGNLVIDDRYTQYTYATTMNGTNNPFSLVDIYRKMLGTTELPLIYSPVERLQNQNKKIIIHPFASSKKKKWGMTKWNEVIYQILKSISNAQIYIMGGNDDNAESDLIKNSEILKKYLPRLTFNIGNLSLADTFNQFADADLFIGHDSMGGHMAAINSIPSITLSLGTVRPHETTPYGHNNYNITPKIKCFPCYADEKCELLPCHTNISYQAVTVLVKGILNNEEINEQYLTTNVSNYHLDTVNIYKTDLNPNYGLRLIDLTGDYTNLANLFKQFYFSIWSYVFSEVEVKEKLPKLSSKTLSELTHYQIGIEHLFELNNFGLKYSKYILDETNSKSPQINLIKDYSKKLAEVDQLSNLLKNTYPLLAPLIDFYFVAKANLKGNNIIELAESSYVTYFEANNAVGVMAEFIQLCLNEAKAKVGTTRNKTPPTV